MTKNIEICKAEEVGAQVLDEQPQDYLAVQEAAYRYGITLPAPSQTNPIPELRGVLSTFARKVVTVFTPYIDSLRSQLTTANSGIRSAYLWLMVRINKSYLPTPELPYAQDAEHLSANLQACLGNRRISNGDSSQVPDGISLARFYARYRTTLTELIDDNTDNLNISQFFTKNFLNQDYTPWSAIRTVITWAKSATAAIGSGLYYNYTNLKAYLTYMERVPTNLWSYNANDDTAYPSGEGEPIPSDKYRSGGFTSAEMHIQAATTSALTTYANGMPFCTFKRIYLYRFAKGYLRFGGSHANNYDHSPTTYIYVGCTGEPTDQITLFCHTTTNYTITTIEIGEHTCQSLAFLGMSALTEECIYNILSNLDKAHADVEKVINFDASTATLTASTRCMALAAELSEYNYTFTGVTINNE